MLRMLRINSALTFLITLFLGALHTFPSVARGASDLELPVSFTAGAVHYDWDKGIITASQGVEVSHEGNILLANTISYDQNADVLAAAGDVSLLEPSGDVYFASSMRLSGDLKNGVANDLRALFADKSRLVAVAARRKGGVISEWDKAVYTPCKPCAENPERAPLWQLKAVKVWHNKDEQIGRAHV